MKKILLSLICLWSFTVWSQQLVDVKGFVIDSSGEALPGASIKLFFQKDSAIAISREDGSFSLNMLKADTFSVYVTYSGLQSFRHGYKIPEKSKVYLLETIMLLPRLGELEEVVVEAVKAITVKTDTIQYAAAAYPVREGAAVEEVVKKLPGITVDQNGNMETNGKKIEKVRVNGKDFFGGDAQTALQNLPADIVSNIQLIDDYGDQANLTGVKTGEPRKILNINIQKNKNKGSYSNFIVAGGNKGRYIGNLTSNIFSNDRQISIQGTFGNTSANMTNNNAGGGGGGAGITQSRMLALNYRDKIGKKMTIYGSYILNSRDNTLQTSSYSQDFNPLNIRVSQRESNNWSLNVNHRLNFNVEYSIDSFNYVKFTPNVSFSHNESINSSYASIARINYLTQNDSKTASKGQTPNYGATLLYNHRFGRTGRNFSMQYTATADGNDQDRNSRNGYHREDSTVMPIRLSDTLQMQTISNTNNSFRSNAHLSYLEPLDAKKTTFLEFSYDYNRVDYNNSKQVYDLIGPDKELSVLNSRQSDLYNYEFVTHKVGIGFRSRKQKYNYHIGGQYQPLELRGTSESRHFNTVYKNTNWIPSARFVYNFTPRKTLTTSLEGSAREPGFYQLQPISDSTNLENILKGNPELRNEFSYRLSSQYNWNDFGGNGFYFNAGFDKTQDKIVTSRTNNISGTGRTTTYLNTDGFYGYNMNLNYTRAFSKRKYLWTTGMGYNYDNNISFTDGQKNHGSNWNFRPSMSFRIDVRNKIDWMVRVSYNMFSTTTRYTTSTKTTAAQTLQLGLSGKHFIKDLSIGYDFSQLFNYNFGGTNLKNPAILNLFVDYRFFKKKNVTLKMQAFDVFDKYNGLTRVIRETTITDTRSQKLGRYYLLSISVRLAKFGNGVKPKRAFNMQENNFRGGGRKGGNF